MVKRPTLRHIAYHMDKLDRGFDQITYLCADHHGYIARVSAMKALGANPDQLHVPLVQFAILYRGGEKGARVDRGSDFVTLEQLRTEVGNGTARFFYADAKGRTAYGF